MVALLVALVVLAGTAQAEMRPISESAMKDDAAFVWERCESLYMASLVLRQILTSNPVSGRNPSLGSEFDWAAKRDVFDELDAARPDDAKSNGKFIGEYMDAFGPIEIPSLVPNSPLYQMDVARCRSIAPSFGG